MQIPLGRRDALLSGLACSRGGCHGGGVWGTVPCGYCACGAQSCACVVARACSCACVQLRVRSTELRVCAVALRACVLNACPGAVEGFKTLHVCSAVDTARELPRDDACMHSPQAKQLYWRPDSRSTVTRSSW